MARAKAKWIFGPQQSQSASNTNTSASAQQQIALPVLSTADAKKFGLENFGNTCYANSVIQALYFCAPFRQLIVQAPDHSILANPTPPSPIISSSSPGSPPPTSPIPVRRQPERKQSSASHTQSSTQSTEALTINGAGSYGGVGVSPTLPSPLSSRAPAPVSIPPHPPTLFSALRSLYVYISTHPSEKGTVSPRAFIEKLKEVNELFRSTTQHQDAHEFLNYLLNKIVEEMEEERRTLAAKDISPTNGDDLSNSIATITSKVPTIVTTSTSSNAGTAPQDATLVHKLFEGVLTSETRCLTCETVSSRDESFLDLSIDIEQNSSVTACLRQFSASEMLCQRNKFFCDACCDLQEAEKRMKIKKLPNVLALHLKRFKFQEDLQKYVKLAYRVAFPFELRLFNTVDDAEDADRLYELFSIVVHIGNGPHHGHYVSIIKTLGTWLVFDDDNVYPISESDIHKYYGDPHSNAGSAYVLYYQAKDINLAALGLRVEPDPVAEDSAGGSVTMDNTITGVGGVKGVGVNGFLGPDGAPLLPPGLSTEDTGGSDRSTSVHESLLDTTTTHPHTPNPNTNTSASAPRSGMGGLLYNIKLTGSTSIGEAGPVGRRSGGDSTRPVSAEDDTKGGDRGSVDRGSISGNVREGSGQKDGKEGKEKRKGKEKDEDKKGTGWFGKRKSFKTKDREKGHFRALTEAESNDPSSSTQDSSALLSASTRFKASGNPSGDRTRKSYEPVSLFDHFHLHQPSSNRPNGNVMEKKQAPASSFTVIRPRTASSAVPRSEVNGSGYDSPVSTTSSLGSASLSHSSPTPTLPDHSKSKSMQKQLPRPPPPSRDGTSNPPPVNIPSVGGPSDHHHHPTSPVARSPEHKKSFPHLTTLKKSMLRGDSSIPPRPSTAGGQPPPSTDILPPLPTPPFPFMIHHQRNRSNGNAIGAVPDPRSPTIKGKGKDEGTTESASPVTGAGSLTSPDSASQNNLRSGVAGAGGNLKRATRKLSLTAPMLGFGKKDKDREKEKEKEREKDERNREKDQERPKHSEQLPPSSFTQFSTMTTRF